MAPSMADVEVEELTLDDEEFDTAFGPLTTQFTDLEPEPREADPWSGRRRLD